MTIVNLFEQSGTFKRILRARGHKSVDVDIENRFNETDIQMNLFDCVLNENPPAMLYSLLCYADLVFMFFPCTWFSMNNDMIKHDANRKINRSLMTAAYAENIIQAVEITTESEVKTL